MWVASGLGPNDRSFDSEAALSSFKALNRPHELFAPIWASENGLDRQQPAPPVKTDVRCGGSVWLKREHRYLQIVESTGNVRVWHQHVRHRRVAWGRRIRRHDDVHRLRERIDGAANEIAK